MANNMNYSSKKKRALLAKKISIETRGKIGQEQYKSKLKPTKGARAIFLEKYRITGDIDKVKKELEENGFDSSIYEDKVYQTWIDEDRDK